MKKKTIKTIFGWSVCVALTNVTLSYFIRSRLEKKLWEWFLEDNNLEVYSEYIKTRIVAKVEVGKSMRYLPVKARKDLIMYSMEDLDYIRLIIEEIKEEKEKASA